VHPVAYCYTDSHFQLTRYNIPNTAHWVRDLESSWNVMAHGNARWGGGGVARGKLANAMCSQYPSHYLRKCCIQHYYRWCAHLGCQQSTELTPNGRFKWTVRFRHKDQLWFLHVCHHISTGFYCSIYTAICVCPAFGFTGCWFLLYGYISMQGQQNI